MVLPFVFVLLVLYCLCFRHFSLHQGEGWGCWFCFLFSTCWKCLKHQQFDSDNVSLGESLKTSQGSFVVR